MIAVTAGIVILIAIMAVLVNTLIKLSVKRDTPDFTVMTASLITAGPAAVIHIGFVAVVSVTAF